MAQVNMPEKKDSMGQGMQIFQMAKSAYDMKNGGVQPGQGVTDPKAQSSTAGTTTAMQRRYDSGRTA